MYSDSFPRNWPRTTCTAILFTQQFTQAGGVACTAYILRCEAICVCKHSHVHKCEAIRGPTYSAYVHTTQPYSHCRQPQGFLGGKIQKDLTQWRHWWLYWDSSQPVFDLVGGASPIRLSEWERGNCGSDCGELSTWFTGEADVAVKIRVYNATRYIAPGQGNVPRGTRLLLICDVEGLPEGNVVISYRWYHSSTSTGRSEIRRGDPYHTPVNDNLLVDTTSWGGGTRNHGCEGQYLSKDERSHNQSQFIRISPTGEHLH